ncbi:MAG: hypothetical protein DRQ51_01010 [Gammaproteobacteria bacterium]|nr:MAG: hypothetical protein DRQ51_01010 [Gammaproteobacteria bacterium]
MQTITLNINDDYMQNFKTILKALPKNKITIAKNEDELFLSTLKNNHKKDYVNKNEIFEALSVKS